MTIRGSSVLVLSVGVSWALVIGRVAATPVPPSVGEACLSVEIDAERLACYDAAFDRARGDTRQADLEAGTAARYDHRATHVGLGISLLEWY